MHDPHTVLTTAALLGMLLSLAATGSTADVGAALEQARDLAERHHYAAVLELLQPLADSVQTPEEVYAICAEIGRAHFHLGQYQEADASLRRAVKIHPERVESALYLEATSYLTGRREQALSIFRELLLSGSTDLYLAVTLPGETTFLAETEVWSILDEHAVPVAVNLDTGSLLDARLGLARSEVMAILGADPANQTAPVLTARAGPKLIWAFSFSADDRLAEILVHAEHLARYTPYRLRLGHGLDWRTTASQAMSALGPPSETTDGDNGDVVLTWKRPEAAVSLAFGQPQEPRPAPITPGTAMLLLVRLQSTDAAGDPTPTAAPTPNPTP